MMRRRGKFHGDGSHQPCLMDHGGLRPCDAGAVGKAIPVICPSCHVSLSMSDDGARCPSCQREYTVQDGVLIFSQKDELYEDMQTQPIRKPAFERGLWAVRLPAYLDFCLSRKQVRLRFLYEAVQTLSRGGSKVVLDVGSGAGKETLTRLGPVAGIDISLKALSNARRLYQVCVRHDIREGIPFPDSTFDVVNCADVLGHFDEADRNRLLSEIHRVLRPGGWLITIVETWSAIYDRNMRKFPDWYPALCKEAINRTGHIGLEPAKGVVSRLERHGFRALRKQVLAGNWGYTRAHVSWTDKYPTATRREALLRKLCTLAVGSLYTEALMDDFLGLLDILSNPRPPEDEAIAIMVLAQARNLVTA